jgi:mannose-6-phosphate isomerase-like protein (cupin superfamily)
LAGSTTTWFVTVYCTPVNFPWHIHREQDEMFLVLTGELLVDMRESTFVLTRHKGATVPRDREHRVRIQEPTVILMVEGADVVPTCD